MVEAGEALGIDRVIVLIFLIITTTNKSKDSSRLVVHEDIPTSGGLSNHQQIAVGHKPHFASQHEIFLLIVVVILYPPFSISLVARSR